MVKSNSRVTQEPVTTAVNVHYRADHIPNVGGKMFRRTSESAGKTR